jgi:AsmA protein
LQKEDGTGGLSVPLKITGPWARPRFQLDMEALAKPKLDAERARAEKKLAEKLGADTENGETLEDAAKRKLETELRRGLGKLFGGN